MRETIQRLAAAVLCGSALACGPPPFTLTVTFPDEVGIEAGARVQYQGIDVGHVDAVRLRQDDPALPASVEVVCAIEDAEIQLRRDDWFEVATDGMLGDTILRITPSPESSPPLASGSSVVGTPPLVTRVRESAGEALESLGSLVGEKARAWLDDAEAPDTPDPPEAAP